VFSVDPTDAPIDRLDSDLVISVYSRSMSVPRLCNESHELEVQSELEPGVRNSTRCQPVKTSRVIRRFYLYVIFGICNSVRLLGRGQPKETGNVNATAISENCYQPELNTCY
jgi:hypothetical protein